MSEHKQALYMHEILVGPTRIPYTVMRTDRYMTDAERSQWATRQEAVIDLESRWNGVRNTEIWRELEKARIERDAFGAIVPGDYGMDKRPARLLADALGYYANNVDDIRQANLDIIGMAEDAGEGYDPERLFPEVELTDDEYHYAEAVVKAVGHPVLLSIDIIEQVETLSKIIRSNRLAQVLTDADMDVIEPIMETLDIIAEYVNVTSHVFLTTDGDLVK